MELPTQVIKSKTVNPSLLTVFDNQWVKQQCYLN